MRLVTTVMLAALTAIAVTAAAADIVKGIVDPYLKAQTALADDELSGAKTAAAAIATEAARLGTEGEALVTAARKLEAADNLETARDAFGAMTNALIKYADATHTTLGSDVKLAWCPMNQKTWAQKGDQVANPYFGKAMRTCGEFKKPGS